MQINSHSTFKEIGHYIEGFKFKKVKLKQGESLQTFEESLHGEELSSYKIKRTVRSAYLDLQTKVLAESNLFAQGNPARDTSHYEEKVMACARFLEQHIFEGVTEVHLTRKESSSSSDPRKFVCPTYKGNAI